MFLGVDASQFAVDLANENSKFNGLENTVKFECHDVFDFLPELEAQGELFDMVILDPLLSQSLVHLLRMRLKAIVKLI